MKTVKADNSVPQGIQEVKFEEENFTLAAAGLLIGKQLRRLELLEDSCKMFFKDDTCLEVRLGTTMETRYYPI